MSDHDTTTQVPGVVTFTLPEGTKVTAPRRLAEALGWQPGDTTPARRGKK